MTLITETRFIHPDAPTCYPKGRKCSKCRGPVSRYTKPVGSGIRGGMLGSGILLCNLCERKRVDAGLQYHEFVKMEKPGRTYSYFLFGLRAARRKRGLTQKELATLIRTSEPGYCSPETIAAAERTGDRRRRVSTKMAGKLSRALGVSVAELKEDLRGEG